MADTPDSGSAARHSANIALGLLITINLFNYIDRQVLAAVEPQIRETLFPTLGDEDAKFRSGLLASAFLVTYMIMSPLFGMLADRKSRWLLVGFGIFVWTLASGVSGLAVSFAMLFITRCLVGFGEAAYGPVAPSLISDMYPVASRGKIMAWFYMAIPVGSALGYALGGVIVSLTGNWRIAFFAVVPPGLILAACCLFMRDPKRGATDLPDSTEEPEAEPMVPPSAELDAIPLKERNYRILARIPSYVLCTAGMTAMTFALGGIAWWISAYLKHKGIPDQITLFGVIVASTGLIATLSGGILGDKLRGRFPGSYFLVSGSAMWIAVPFLIWFPHCEFPFAWFPLTIAVFCLFFNTGPTNTILANVTHPHIRSSAFALNILIIHLLGDVISPPLLGVIIGDNHFDRAFYVTAGVVFLGGAFWWMGAKYLQADTEAAPHLPIAKSDDNAGV